ncbi:hypothetical protein Q5O14_13885 [Eubacteriaceae bacterium ES2]|nr:hypothetical protein Q5O14_13885 [Eubacteriaceae bacterium ES2]
MIRVRIYTPGFCDYGVIDEMGYMSLADGENLNDVLKKLKVPLVYRSAQFTGLIISE